MSRFTVDEDGFYRARLKLDALAFLFSEIRVVSEVPDKVMHGVGWLLYDLRDDLKLDKEDDA